MSAWVLLRGLARESGHWGPFAAQLSQALGGAAVTTLDLPGAGRFHGQVCPATIEAIAERCRAELAATQPVVLLGLSMGAMVALAWARRHPGEVRAGVLVNTSVAGLSPPWQRMRAGRWPTLLALAARWPRDEVEREILHLTSHDPARHARVLEHWQAIRAARPVSARNALRQLRAAARYRVPQPPPVPLLAVCSEGDRLVHPRCTQVMAARWQLPLRVHPKAGHDLPLDDGEWLAATVARWARERGLIGASPKPGD